MRDDKWLFEKLDMVWDKYFADVPQENDVCIVWGRRARTRLGSIRQIQADRFEVTAKDKNYNLKFKTSNLGNHPATIITINSLFKNREIPEYVVLGTIAHEMAHYAHGFHSPIKQKYATPHAGGVIHKEMGARGLDKLEKKQKKWLKENWRDYVLKNLSPTKPRRRKRKIIIKWI